MKLPIEHHAKGIAKRLFVRATEAERERDEARTDRAVALRERDEARDERDTWRHNYSVAQEEESAAREALSAAQSERRAPLRYESNGEVGDGQWVCRGCGEERDEPHTWRDCAARLADAQREGFDHAVNLDRALRALARHAKRLRRNLAATAQIARHLARERDEARAEVERLTHERDNLHSIACDLLGRIERRHDSTDLDWACRECRPDSHMLIPGWVCAVHRMAAIRAATEGSVMP